MPPPASKRGFLPPYFLVVAIVLVLLLALFALIKTANVPLTFSPTQVLGALYRAYTLDDLEASSGRTLDASRGNITTSEGESYTMLRAVWEGDKSTFDTSWQWTKDNLQHSQDHLFSWLFGKEPNGSYGVLANQGGTVAASDADTDIALSLVFAYARWQDSTYLDDARGVINDIWDKEVIVVNGTPYLAANDIEKTSPDSSFLIDPSYLNPAAYRIFARVDTTHPWNSLVDSSYTLLGNAITNPLGGTSSDNLPPDWVRMDKATGALLPPGNNLTTNFGFDALRVPFRLSLDYEWSNDPRDLSLLSKMSFLGSSWSANHALSSTYSHQGQVTYQPETYAMYGGTLGYFMHEDPSAAKAIYQSKLLPVFDADTNRPRASLGYYDDNWAWFGLALYNHLLPNLTASLPEKALTAFTDSSSRSPYPTHI